MKVTMTAKFHRHAPARSETGMPAYDYQLLIKQLLLTPISNKSPRKIVYGDRRYSYPEFRGRVGKLGSALTKLGVQRGETVAVMDWDSNRYLECYFAIPMLGAVLQTVNVRLSPEQVTYCLNHAEAKTLICNLEFLPLYEQIRADLTSVERIVWISEAGVLPEGIGGAGEYEDFIAEGDPEHAFPDFDENTRATLFYTTGTTGLPKGVSFTHRQLVLHTLVTSGTFCFSQEEVYLPITPMFHVHAWGMPYVATMNGCQQVYPGRYLPDNLLRLIREEKATFSHCVPTILQMLLSAPSSQDTDLRGLRMVIGGSALPRALCEAALARGINIFAGYGMSETCPILTVAQIHPDQVESKDEEIVTRTRAGQVVPLVDLRIVDPDMHDVPDDGTTAGEVVVRTPWLTQAYYKDEAATEALWAGGYLHTQDVGVVTPKGYLHITDRIKDVIKTGGEWVSSVDLESIISQHPGVAEVAVIGLPDSKWGERPAAIVVTRAGSSVAESDIKDQVLRHAESGVVSKYAVPEHVFFVSEIPKTSVGKLNKKSLRQSYTVESAGKV
jgi:fatty-acyl-CoA synthase